MGCSFCKLAYFTGFMSVIIFLSVVPAKQLFPYIPFYIARYEKDISSEGETDQFEGKRKHFY